MIKLVILWTKVIVLALIALLFSSCKYNVELGNGIDGNGNVKTENRTPAEKFTKIDNSRGLALTVEQSSAISVSVEADENLLKHIIIKVENGTLVVTTDEDMDDYTTRKVTVKMPVIEKLSVDSGASIATVNTLTGAALKLHSDSGSELIVKAEYDAIDADCSSGSLQKLSGKSLKLTLQADSGSNLEAKKLLSNAVIATSSSGSSVSVHPLVSLNANASSGASIDYVNEPKTIKKDESSGGSINKS